MADRQAAAFQIDIQEVCAFNVSSLGGRLDTGTLLATCKGIRVSGGPSGTVLLHCPLQGASSLPSPAIELMHIQR